MKKKRTIVYVLVLIFTFAIAFGQPAKQYEISFENALHHEAVIKATFSNLENLALGNLIDIYFVRYNLEKTTKLTLIASKNYKTELSEIDGKKPSKKVLEKRIAWLGPK